MQIKVGDYARAALVAHVPASELDVDLIREGLVIELRNGNSECVLLAWNETEFTCTTEGAVLVPDESLDPAILSSIQEMREALLEKKK